MVGHHRGFSGFDAAEEVAVGKKAKALTPGAIAGGEVGFDVKVLAQIRRAAAMSSSFNACELSKDRWMVVF